jgi:hypothetical protein
VSHVTAAVSCPKARFGTVLFAYRFEVEAPVLCADPSIALIRTTEGPFELWWMATLGASRRAVLLLVRRGRARHLGRPAETFRESST